MVLGPNRACHVKSDGEGAGQKPSPGTPSKPSAKLDNDNPGNAQENALNATPNEKSNASPDPTSIKESNKVKGLSDHGKRKPLRGRSWMGYACLSLLHDEALLKQMEKRAINLRVINVDPLPKSERLPSIPKFAFIVWAHEGVAQGEALGESERVLEEYPHGYCTTNADELAEWLRKLFTFKCRRIFLDSENVGEFTQVDVAGDDTCYGVVPRELRDVHYWTNCQVTSKTQMQKAQIRTPPNFSWPDEKYI